MEYFPVLDQSHCFTCADIDRLRLPIAFSMGNGLFFYCLCVYKYSLSKQYHKNLHRVKIQVFVTKDGIKVSYTFFIAIIIIMIMNYLLERNRHHLESFEKDHYPKTGS